MPIREYECQNEFCNYTFESIVDYCTEDPAECMRCGKPTLKRKFSLTAPAQFKGSGWYETDYKKKSGVPDED